MSYTYFSYTGNYPEKKDSKISTPANFSVRTPDICADRIIDTVTKTANEVLRTVKDGKKTVSIMRDGDIIKYNCGNVNRTFHIVEKLEINHNDKVFLTDTQVSRGREMYKSLYMFAKKYKGLTLSNVAVMETDVAKQNREGNFHKVLTISVQSDNSVYVVSYDTINQKYYVSKLSDWSYDMIYALYVNISTVYRSVFKK